MTKAQLTALQSRARPPVVGAVFGFVLVVGAIIASSHSFLAFFSLGGLMIVVGGVIAVAFMSFDADDVRSALNAIRRMLNKPRMTHDILHSDMKAIIYCAHLVREKGIVSLETVISKSGIRDPFVKYGMNMAVSQYPAEDVRRMLETAADAQLERDSVPADILHAMASHAPAFGMVGTLVGMVAMLTNIGDDVSKLGASLAVSFLSTLYGVVSARMVYIPAAAKVEQEAANNRFRNHLITEGLVMLVNNRNPMHIQDHLNSFLRPDKHDYFNVIKVAPVQPKPEMVHAA